MILTVQHFIKNECWVIFAKVQISGCRLSTLLKIKSPKLEMKNLVMVPTNAKANKAFFLLQSFLFRNTGQKAICLFALLFTIHYSLYAQPSFTTKLSTQKIGVGQQLEISYEMANANSVEAFTAPKFMGFAVVGGPMQSTENTNINGKSSSRSTISYFLQPLKTGKATIGGAQAVIDGKPVTSNNVTVDVQAQAVDLPADQGQDPSSLNPFNDPFFAPDQRPVQPAQDPAFVEASVLRPDEDMQKKINKNLFIKVYTNKTTVYEGEPIVATYKVYSRLDMTAGVTKRPSFSGFSAFDMEEPSQSGTLEKFNGQNYMGYTIRKVQLYPLQSGQLVLEPVEVDCDIKFLKLDRASQPSFNQNDPANQQQTHFILKSQAIKINALPFPEQNKPADFKGAVGNFNIQAVTTANEIGKDDAEKLQVTITGNGNFSAVQSPDVAWPASIEAYDPKQKDNLDQTISPMNGTKNFEYVFICHQPGQDTIPSITFSYFDAVSKTYKTLSTNPIFLSILAQSKHPQKKLQPGERNIPESFIKTAKYAFPLLAIALIIFLAFSLPNKKKNKQLQAIKDKKLLEDAWGKSIAEKNKEAEMITPKAHESYMPINLINNLPINHTEKTNQENVKISIALPESDGLLWLGDDKSFFQALKNDILKALTNLSNSYGRNKIETFELLKKQGKDETVLQQLKSLLDECDAVAYSPMPIPADRHAMLEEAKYLLEKI